MIEQKLNSLVKFSNAMADAVAKAGAATVLVNPRHRLPASGIVYAPSLVLTANHTVEFEEEIKVMVEDGR